ncbi:hypothetical protein K6T82_11315 [Flavobacterium sp. 17A]|uniref:Uncharacterized protein n=1 Tax=Flavobacterium potami TaxID=2872310 RepID=A0A9X1HAZ7_9FLAO|nr:hypothetical protein [Flavobacterium potami]MBZ4035357.1 hypothetical protein [Flavobacterium potami]
MPLIRVYDKNLILSDDSYSEKYWGELSRIIEAEFGISEIKNPNQVEQVLKVGFQYFCQKFEALIQKMQKASFYIFVNCIHEDSLDLYQLQLKKVELGIDENAFAISRRILKIIIEQGCKMDLAGTPNFFKEITINQKEYLRLTEELLYVGEKAYEIVEMIAKNKLFPGSTGTAVEDGEFTMYTYQPYPELYRFIYQDIPKHDDKVALSESIYDFKDILKSEYGVEYDALFGFTSEQLKKPEYRFGLIFLDNLIDTLHKELGYDKSFLHIFYDGLTLSAQNALSVEDCILKNQDPNRFIYRPIVKFFIDNKFYYMIPYNKWGESMVTLTTNAFPFGVYPQEWKQLEVIKNLVQHLDNTHDKVLESPIKALLDEHKLFYDTSVESFKNKRKQNTNIAGTVGDIDILYLDTDNKLIYVCELKHNRSRFDYNNWRRDYSNFKPKYEKQLDRKVEWSEHNKNVIQEHFEVLYGAVFAVDLKEYSVRGIFIINAPTIYMYDGKYRAFTVRDMSLLLKGEYVDVTFDFTLTSTGKKYLIGHPYFENIRKKIL